MTDVDFSEGYQQGYQDAKRDVLGAVRRRQAANQQRQLLGRAAQRPAPRDDSELRAIRAELAGVQVQLARAQQPTQVGGGRIEDLKFIFAFIVAGVIAIYVTNKLAPD